MNIKIRLVELDKRQADLLKELHRMGYSEIDPSTMSKIVCHKLNTPKAYMIREIISDILTQWEEEREAE